MIPKNQQVIKPLPNDDKQASKDSGIIPIEATAGTIIVPTSEDKTTTVTTCSDGSDKSNDQICLSAEQTNQQKETVVQQQNTVTPQVTQAVHTEYLDNSLNTIFTQADNINDNTLPIQLNNSTQWRNVSIIF